MANAEQIRRGIERYVNEEFVSNMSGWQQFAAGTALGVILPKIKGEVDVEEIYRSAVEQISRRPEGITLTKKDMQQLHPVIGTMVGAIISSVTFRQSDIDKLYRYIMEG